MKISRYVLVDREGNEQDYEYEEHEYQEAESEALERGFAIIERTYLYDDSELIWTPNGKNTWP